MEITDVPGPSLLDLVTAGGALVSSLDRSSVLRALAQQLVAVAHAEGCAVLSAASGPGERLVGAALALGGDCDDAPDGAGTAVICDVVVASGSSLAAAAARARRAGAARVVAAVVRDMRPAGAPLPPGVDELVLLDVPAAGTADAVGRLTVVG
jgi:hypothetical protein